MAKHSLFRMEAVQAQQVQWLGGIVLVRPLSFAWLTAGATACALLIILFLMCGSYTKRSTVGGQLAPDSGMVKVYAAQAGIVVQKKVAEGQPVKRGDVLFLISSDRQDSTHGDVQAAISGQVALRQQSLRMELEQTRTLQRDEEAALRKRIEALRAEQANIARQLDGQRSRTELAAQAVKRYKLLMAKGFISKEMQQQRQADFLDQNNRLAALERDRISIDRELLGQEGDLAILPIRHQKQLAQIERLLTSTGQEWTESEAKRRLAITAPESGIATALTAEAGQTVDGGKPLVSIVPAGSQLQAHLYAPSRAIGFIRQHDQVLLRYQAFPYQKFGHAYGRVASVSRIALTASEYASAPHAAAASGEALYRITVNLQAQTINAYGKPQPLQAGMLLEADVLQERRRLIEWVLEPLYSLSGKL